MKSAKNVIKQTLASLERKDIEATPSAYEAEFLEISKKINFISHDSNDFDEIIKKLSLSEQREVELSSIATFNKLSYLLLKRTNQESINNLSSLVMDSLEPSIAQCKDGSLDKFINKVKTTDGLLFKNDMQMDFKRFIEHRINIDKTLFETSTKNISKLSTLLDSQVDDVISINNKSSNDISKITKDITNIEKPNLGNLNLIHAQLESTAKSIEINMEKSTKKLQKSKSEISSLKEQVEKLEKELLLTKKENEIDHLTTLYTRKAYDKHAQNMEEQYLRNKINYAIVFFDIDHFKNVNDTYGHEGGDIILSTFAKILLRGTRETDIVGRYGGEEFVGILHFKEISEIETYIKRIKGIVSKNKFAYDKHRIDITFSAGVTIRSENESYLKSMNLADELLYKAKNSGRNKIIFQNGVEI